MATLCSRKQGPDQGDADGLDPPGIVLGIAQDICVTSPKAKSPVATTLPLID